MAITNNLVVVIQNEPRDGDIVYVEKDEQHFKDRVREVIDIEWDDGDIELGQDYYDEDNFCSLIGHEVQFPYPINNVCHECFKDGEEDAVHEVGSHLVVNFVAEADCQNGHKEE